MKIIIFVLGVLATLPTLADVSAQELIEASRETAILTREYARELNPGKDNEFTAVLFKFKTYYWGAMSQHVAIGPYTKVYGGRRQGWLIGASEDFANHVFAQPKCHAYLGAYTRAYEWARSEVAHFAVEEHAQEIAPKGPETHTCYAEAYEWARRQGWMINRSKQHARNYCL
ncbi:MAG: hypothetical protein R2827_08420 [Bdellovibrionales bacterium]